MTHEKKLKFIQQMTHLGLSSIPLQHYDLGGLVSGGAIGTVLGGPVGGQIAGAAGGLSANTPTASGTGIAGIASNALGLTNNFQAGSTPITQGTNAAQLGTAYTGAQQGITDQAGLVGQTQPGVAQGLGTQNNLSGQLAAEAAGQGPNPAQAALNQSTGNNIAQQAALAANTRGAASNAGGIAVNNAQQGAATQQQAIGQAATLQAQQQLAAQQNQQNLAATQVGQGAGAIQGENQTQQNEQNILQGANTSANNAAVSQQSNINNVNAATAQGNQNLLGSVIGGFTSGASSALSSVFAHGGEVKKMASGGFVTPTPLVVNPSGPQSFVGQWLNSSVNPGQGPVVQPMYTNEVALNQPNQQKQAEKKQGDEEEDSQPTGELAGDPSSNPADTMTPMTPNLLEMSQGLTGPTVVGAKGGKVSQMKKMLPMMHGKNQALIAKGGKVKADGKGEKAVVNKDSYSNDKVPALLSQGEVVMDKDTLNDPGPIGQMARAVAHHIATRNSSNKGKMKRV